MTDPTGPRGGANSPALKTAVITTLVCLLLLTQVYSQGQQIQDQKDPQVHPVKDHAQAEAVPGIRCSNNTRQCWCVDESGSLIEGSYTSPLHSDLPDCEKILRSHQSKTSPNERDKPVKEDWKSKASSDPELPKSLKVDSSGGSKSDAPTL